MTADHQHNYFPISNYFTKKNHQPHIHTPIWIKLRLHTSTKCGITYSRVFPFRIHMRMMDCNPDYIYKETWIFNSFRLTMHQNLITATPILHTPATTAKSASIYLHGCLTHRGPPHSLTAAHPTCNLLIKA